ncbi:hypothetical protein M407DRAFT_7571 [Tulasnella calospora MUT 4182]|uniref:Uncharacterized protein n=1 Tax=Tulasnella calospora MUT 4182 TaxID=1051891 RepID=A0A0C3QKG6_9AGAM|nr:hypothetical protein M407DRAFT_7571 [Tulasnella calospora MUT 4182]
MSETKGVDRYSQWAAVEAAVKEVPELGPTGELLRELTELVNHMPVHRERSQRLVRRFFQLVHTVASFPQKIELKESHQVLDKLHRCCSAIHDDMSKWVTLGAWKRLAMQVHGQMARTKTASTWQDKPTRQTEVAALDERHDSEHATEDPDAIPNPSIKRTLEATSNLNKWTKFVTVVPGQHGRFKINTGMGPIYGGFSDVWQCDAKFSDGRIVPAAVKKFRAVRIARNADASTVTNKLLKVIKAVPPFRVY